MLYEQDVCSAVGATATVLKQMERFVERTGVADLMIASQIFDHGVRVRSFEIAMEVWSGRAGTGLHLIGAHHTFGTTRPASIPEPFTSASCYSYTPPHSRAKRHQCFSRGDASVGQPSNSCERASISNWALSYPNRTICWR